MINPNIRLLLTIVLSIIDHNINHYYHGYLLTILFIILSIMVNHCLLGSDLPISTSRHRARRATWCCVLSCWVSSKPMRRSRRASTRRGVTPVVGVPGGPWGSLGNLHGVTRFMTGPRGGWECIWFMWLVMLTGSWWFLQQLQWPMRLRLYLNCNAGVCDE